MRFSKEAVQVAARQAARQTSSVYKAVINGSKPPMPAGWGVEPASFKRALPWLRGTEITTVANHFGQRGEVVGEIASEFAAEVGRRLRLNAEGSAGQTGTDVAPALAGDLPLAVTGLSAFQVAAVTYSLSKLGPRHHDCALVFDAVAHGILQGAWSFSRLQTVLVGTALADVEAHLSDALPALLRPLLRELAEDSSELTLDELRYLVHACAHLPWPHGLTAEEVTVLSDATRKLAVAKLAANFSIATHLVVSWLQLEAPPDAKQAHFEALRAACDQLYGQAPQNPAHPLPAKGLAPAIVRFLARERDLDPPPLTPPRLRGICHALMQISRGLRSDAARRSASLTLQDWAMIARVVTEFCEAHGGGGPKSRSGTTLPSWAAQMLGYVFNMVRPEDELDLESVLILLRLLRRHRPQPSPSRRFVTWAAEQVATHHRQAAQAGYPDQTTMALLAEAIGELVPRLPEEERGKLTHLLVTTSLASEAPSVGGSATQPPLPAMSEARPAAGVAGPRPLLVGRPSLTAAGAALDFGGGRFGVPPAPRVKLSAATAQLSAASGTASPGRAVHNQLWRSLIAREPVIQPSGELFQEESLTQEMMITATADEAAVDVESKLLPAEVLAPVEDPVAEVADAAVEVCEETPRGEEDRDSTAAATPAPSAVHLSQGQLDEVEELRTRLEMALTRVEALEVRLRERHESPPVHDGSVRQPYFMADALAGTPGGAGSMKQHLSAAFAPAHFPMQRRPFVFEEFRRANSRELQSQRLRVLAPPDHLPMWGLSKKR